MENQHLVAINIFRILPQSIRIKISVGHVKAFIRLKSQLLNKLTYSEKCLIGHNELAGMLYGQLFWEKGFTLQVILEILRAEEMYLFSSYNNNYENESMFFEAA